MMKLLMKRIKRIFTVKLKKNLNSPMLSLTPPAILTILTSVGFEDVQPIPITGHPDAFYILLKDMRGSLSWRKPILEAMKPFGAKFGSTRPEGEPNKKDYDYVEVSGYKIFIRKKEDFKKEFKKLNLTLSHGVKNEKNFHYFIDEYLKIYKIINIEFQEHGRTFFTITGAKAIYLSGRDTEERKKSDINIVTRNTVVPLSLKQNDASNWEVPATYLGEKTKNMFEYARAKHGEELQFSPIDKVGNYYLQKNITMQCSTTEARDFIFGSDIMGKGLVIRQTWQSKDFDWDFVNRTMTVNCTDIIRNMSDVGQDDWPYFQIRNHKDKKLKFLDKGLIINVITKESVSPNDIFIPHDAQNYTQWK